MKFMLLIIPFLILSSIWVPVRKDEYIGPIIFDKLCGENLLLGLDVNRNGIIDVCYEIKWVGKKLYKKHVKMWYEIYDGTILKGQGCVCKE